MQYKYRANVLMNGPRRSPWAIVGGCGLPLLFLFCLALIALLPQAKQERTVSVMAQWYDSKSQQAKGREDNDPGYIALGPEATHAFNSVQLGMQRQEVMQALEVAYDERWRQGMDVIRFEYPDGWVIVNLSADRVTSVNAKGVPVVPDSALPMLSDQEAWVNAHHPMSTPRSGTPHSD
ncbi:MAG TPA: hypothetical protein VKU00_14925 [Chthonomonadaceae bacterium]|nr:hypothetical protein [Chthonomonadaceae bacterium]